MDSFKWYSRSWLGLHGIWMCRKRINGALLNAGFLPLNSSCYINTELSKVSLNSGRNESVWRLKHFAQDVSARLRMCEDIARCLLETYRMNSQGWTVHNSKGPDLDVPSYGTELSSVSPRVMRLGLPSRPLSLSVWMWPPPRWDCSSMTFWPFRIPLTAGPVKSWCRHRFTFTLWFTFLLDLHALLQMLVNKMLYDGGKAHTPCFTAP